MHNSEMRTTIAVDDEVMEKVKKLAKRSGLTLGQAVTRVLQDGLHAQAKPVIKHDRGMPVIVSPDRFEKPDFEALVRDWKERG
jgi:hypothetical protein